MAAVLEYIPLDQIELDKENPRIKKFLEMYGDNPTPMQFYLALGAASGDEDDHSATFQKLKASIQTNKGIVQPIIVNRRNGTLVCVEGNTRVALYRQFREDKVPGPWDTIPGLVYEDMETRRWTQYVCRFIWLGPARGILTRRRNTLLTFARSRTCP